MYILFDIGGTKTRVAYSKDGETLGEPVIFETPTEYDAGIKKLKEVVHTLASGKELKAIAGGIAGPFGGRSQSLLMSPNLSDWIGKPLKQDLEKEYGVMVLIENDSTVVGLGEALYGAGKGYGIVAYLTISTGVGGTRIIDGRIDEKYVGFEPGHQIIDLDKTKYPDADGVYFGNYVSGKGVEKRTGKKPEEIADAGFWEDLARVVAVGVHNMIVFWSPHVVVLGGSMMNTVGIPLPIVEEEVKKLLKIFPEPPTIVCSALGDVGGLYGALALIKNNIENK